MKCPTLLCKRVSGICQHIRIPRKHRGLFSIYFYSQRGILSVDTESDKPFKYFPAFVPARQGQAGLKDENSPQKVLEEGIFLNQQLLDLGLAVKV